MKKVGSTITHSAAIARAFEPTAVSLKRLRNKILWSLLLVSMVPLLILSVYFHYQFKTTLETRSKLQLETLASSHRQAVDRFIHDKISALRGVVDSNLINLPPTKSEVEKLLKVLNSLDETILDVGVLDEEGRHVAYSGPFSFLEGKDYSGETWFQSLKDTDSRSYISDVYLGYRDQPHFIIAIEANSNNKKWFIRLTVDHQKFQDFVDDVANTKQTHACIVNNQGIYQAVAENIGCVLQTTPMWASMDKDHDGLFETKMGGESYLVAAQKLTRADWKLVVIQPQSVAYAPINRARVIVVFIMVLGIVATIIASLLATSTLMRRYAYSEANRAELVSQLVQAGKMSTMGEMASGVAHEINNPLAIILSEIGVMEDLLDPQMSQSFDPEDFRKRLNSIREESNRCRSIIHKLLGFARRNKPTIADCDIRDIIQQTIDMINKELSLENIEIRVDVDERLELIQTDENQLEQVLINLIRNGADAIGKNGAINISAHSSGDKMSLIVSDTGCGISSDHIEQIFMPFFTTKDVGKGTGLGLSITHGIITALGGTINVTSDIGHGTAFEIVLPKTHD